MCTDSRISCPRGERKTMPFLNAAEIKKKKKKTIGIDNSVLLAPILKPFFNKPSQKVDFSF